MLYKAVHATFLQQGYAGTEGDELLQSSHVDAVEVGVADLWGTTDEDNLSWEQTVENLDNALTERGATDDGVVDDHKVVDMWADNTVCDVIDMGGKVVALVALSDEGTEFDVFPS